MKSLVFTVPMIQHRKDHDLVWHIAEAIKNLLTVNENREQLTWRKIKNNDDLKGMMKTLASWFQEPEKVVVNLFQS